MYKCIQELTTQRLPEDEAVLELARWLENRKSEHPEIEYKVMRRKKVLGWTFLTPKQRKKYSDAIFIDSLMNPDCFNDGWYFLVFYTLDEYCKPLPIYFALTKNNQKPETKAILQLYMKLGF